MLIIWHCKKRTACEMSQQSTILLWKTWTIQIWMIIAHFAHYIGIMCTFGMKLYRSKIISNVDKNRSTISFEVEHIYGHSYGFFYLLNTPYVTSFTGCRTTCLTDLQCVKLCRKALRNFITVYLFLYLFEILPSS